MADSQEISMAEREKIGLCSNCRFRRDQTTNRGSVFFRCARADEDATFSRYPALPTLVCRGHESDEDFGNE